MPGYCTAKAGELVRTYFNYVLLLSSQLLGAFGAFGMLPIVPSMRFLPPSTARTSSGTPDPARRHAARSRCRQFVRRDPDRPPSLRTLPGAPFPVVVGSLLVAPRFCSCAAPRPRLACSLPWPFSRPSYPSTPLNVSLALISLFTSLAMR
ncbi:uncharacterized protein STEHIDRAFT_163420 [Stereum hirsutum FP-91666 SS1]|uniref:Uncharacterized protein n=1 Tax=Stereum hirsutum (strain FP-91666) TaxID=721885 RepID=R7RWV9_STEHR|nr:uncharacterized protein STEHIDRAFT_163420 [Stereum hirsutum FP-91666 SS1]EIM79866.1 hypothetical protein STEHIDRAFT_163420 [Stereum hirsutum FP-91666 SS1]